MDGSEPRTSYDPRSPCPTLATIQIKCAVPDRAARFFW